MIKKVGQLRVSEIFPVTGNVEYRIPKYQREYTWGTGEWTTLFNDVMDNDEGYFLGSYICVSAGSLGTSELEIIDGQQRFSTLILLLAAIYSRLRIHESEMDDVEKQDFNNVKLQMVNRLGKSFQSRLSLQKQNSNDEDFLCVLSSNGIISMPVAEPKFFGNRRIAKAYRHFCRLIDERVSEETGIRIIDKLFAILQKFNSAILVGIEVDSAKSAYMLFESLNNRGVPLSAIDLMKNTLIRIADDNADECYEKWKRVLTYIGPDDYSVQERFFRQYYNAFRTELNTPFKKPEDTKEYPLGLIATRSTLLDIYESLLKNDYQLLLDDLLEKSAIYSILMATSERTFMYSPVLRSLARIGGAPSYILLLYLLSNQREMLLDDGMITRIVTILVTFFVRRNVTDVPGTRKLIPLFIEIVGKVRGLSDLKVVETITEELRAVSAPDSLFESKLRGPVYEEIPDATRFLLCSIEEANSTREIHTNLWERNNKQYIWTIEHIFPEGENIPDDWVKMITGSNNRELANEYRMKYVHTLGNLTITGYNQNLYNMSFKKKKERKKDGKYIGYRNGLFLNEDVVSEDIWTVDRIQNRTEKLVRTLVQMYSW